jgi:hypothetical protein
MHVDTALPVESHDYTMRTAHLLPMADCNFDGQRITRQHACAQNLGLCGDGLI